MNIIITENQLSKLITEERKIVCDNCGWSWELSEGGKDPYTCHKCGHTNHITEQADDNRTTAILKSIDRNGIMSTLKMFRGSGVFEIINNPSFLDRIKYVSKDDFIKNILDNLHGTLHLSDMGEDPIFYDEDLEKGEVKEISYLTKKGARIDVYDLTYNSSLGEFNVAYYNMSDNLLNIIVMLLLNAGKRMGLY